jgi:hypothetical protein
MTGSAKEDFLMTRDVITVHEELKFSETAKPPRRGNKVGCCLGITS